MDFGTDWKSGSARAATHLFGSCSLWSRRKLIWELCVHVFSIRRFSHHHVESIAIVCLARHWQMLWTWPSSIVPPKVWATSNNCSDRWGAKRKQLFNLSPTFRFLILFKYAGRINTNTAWVWFSSENEQKLKCRFPFYYWRCCVVRGWRIGVFSCFVCIAADDRFKAQCEPSAAWCWDFSVYSKMYIIR